jgi:hypothetical protein
MSDSFRFERMFWSDEHEHHFQTYGYVQLDFLPAVLVAELLQAYHTLHDALPKPEHGFHSTSDNLDVAARRAVDQLLREKVHPYAEQIFRNCKPLFGNFLVKEPRTSSEIGVHQDWTFVDETRYRSVTIWCPLVDTTPENGTLQVLPGSHVYTQNLRGFPTFPGPYDEQQPLTRELMLDLPCKAGQAVVYDHATIHASNPNQTDSPRIALVWGMVPAVAQLHHYYYTGVEYEEYAVDIEFYFHYVKGAHPSTAGGRKIRSIQLVFPKLGRHQILERYAPPGYVPRTQEPVSFAASESGWLSRIRNWLVRS